MSTIARRPGMFRVAFGVLLAVLGGLAAVAFYTVGTTPTDENLFATPPSTAYVIGPVPTAAGAELLPGDLVVAVDGSDVHSAEEVRKAFAARTGTVRITANRPVTRDTIHADLDSALPLPLRDVRGVVVIDVTSGGASERAGMRVGDIIVRINGETFSTALEADRIMRSAQVGREIAYDILRAGEPRRLHVTIAAFGVPFWLLALAATGLLFVAVGAFLGFARPQYAAARLIAVSFVLIGCASVALVTVRPATAFDIVRFAAGVVGLYFGLAALFHSGSYFPLEIPHGRADRWFNRALYLLAATYSGLVMLVGPVLLPAGTISIAVVGTIGRWLLRRHRSPQARHMARIINRTVVLAALGAIGAVLLAGWAGLANNGAYLAVPMAAIPLAYLYTIGRYRLFDLDLRIRRTVRYSVASTLWALGWVVLLVAALVALTRLELPAPNVRMTGGAVELVDEPMSAEHREAVENLLLMVAAIALAFLFRAIGKGGQRIIAARYYRSRVDHRQAGRELAEMLSNRLDLQALARGLVSTLRRTLQIKKLGVILLDRDGAPKRVEAEGFRDEEWKQLTAGTRDLILPAIEQTSLPASVEYTVPALRARLQPMNLHYLVPIRSQRRLVGAIVLGEKRSEAAYQRDDLDFLEATAAQTAVAVENAFLYEELAEQERLKHELAIARRIQLESLPQATPQVDGLDIAGVSIPALEVGGDYYDYLNGERWALTVMVGDVSGKGTSAALYMSKVQGILRSLYGFGLDPRELFIRANQLLWQDMERSSFVTAMGGFFETGRRQIHVTRAGHVPLYRFCRESGEVQRIVPRGLGLGLSSRYVFAAELEERALAYTAGDVFLFITDGITEGIGPDGELFGEDRVMRVLRETADGRATDIRDALTSAVRTFSGDTHQHDDQTVVVVKATN